MKTQDLFPKNIIKEIDIVRSKFPEDKSKSAIIESLLLIQHDNNGFLSDELIASLANYLVKDTVCQKAKCILQWKHQKENLVYI